MGSMHLQPIRIADFFQRIGKTQEDKFMAAQRGDVDVVILNSDMEKRSTIFRL